MNGLSFSKERNLLAKARIGEAGVIRILTFLNADGTDFDITGLNFQFIVKKKENSSKVLFTLSIGDGLAIQDTNKLQITLSEANATQEVDTNFWRLYSVSEDHTWLNGPFYFFEGEYDGLEETDDIIIYENGSEINITISSGASSSEDKRGDWDASGNDAPTTGGSGESGDIEAWNVWRISVESSSWLDSGEPLSEGSFIQARRDNPGQTVNDWARL